ncbi:transmembrane protein 196 [Lampetra planeri]
MCTTRHVLACMLACALFEVACGLVSIALGAASVAWALREAQPVRLGHGAPLWSGVCFLLCGVCGVFCAKRKSGRLMILFSALCICGLIAGILSFRFVWRRGGGAAGRPEGHVAVASLSVAGVGVAGCAASAWLTCRLARNEQRRMFVEMEHSLHHTHELTERVRLAFAGMPGSFARSLGRFGSELAEVLNNGISPVSQGSKSF